jgi:hypothetical protein
LPSPGRFIIAFFLTIMAATFTAACGGDDDAGDSSTGAVTTSAANTAPTTPSGTGTEATGSTASIGTTGATGTTGGQTADAEEFDVCTLVTQAEVEGILGQTVGAPTYTSMGSAGAAAGLHGGDCRFEATGITAVVSIGVLAWSDEDDAESSFSLFDLDDEIEGLGDKAVSTQPVGDISVLQGRYELSVDLYFVNDDDETDLDMARQIAEIAVSRLP